VGQGSSEPCRCCKKRPDQKLTRPIENERQSPFPGEPGVAGGDQQGGVGHQGPVGGVEEVAQADILLLNYDWIRGTKVEEPQLREGFAEMQGAWQGRTWQGGSRTGHVPAVSDSEEKQEVQDG